MSRFDHVISKLRAGGLRGTERRFERGVQWSQRLRPESIRSQRGRALRSDPKSYAEPARLADADAGTGDVGNSNASSDSDAHSSTESLRDSDTWAEFDADADTDSEPNAVVIINDCCGTYELISVERHSRQKHHVDI